MKAMRKCKDEIYQLGKDQVLVDNFSNQITDADEAFRSSEIFVDLIIIIVFLQTYSYFCYILTSFFLI
jgi:hypothetical protein